MVAASRGYIDDIIRPYNTRWRICRALSLLSTKKQQNHGKSMEICPYKLWQKIKH